MPRPETPVGVSGLDAMLEEIEAVMANGGSQPGHEFRGNQYEKVGDGFIPRRFKINKPIIGPTGASIVGYEWRSHVDTVWSEGKQDYVERRVSNWDDSETSTGTGRDIVHVFHVSHPDGTVKPEGIRSAQNVLGISETKLMTIAKKERAAQQYRQQQDEAEQKSIDQRALNTPAEAARSYRTINYSPMRSFEENDAIFRESELWEKGGKFVRRHKNASEQMESYGWNRTLPIQAADPMLDLEEVLRAATSELQERPSDTDVSVKAIIFDAAGRVLVLEASHHDWHDLPGGHLHKGEDIETGLRREIREETGLEIGPVTQTGPARSLILGHKRTVVLFYRAEALTDVVTLSDEHSSYRWVDPKAIDGLNLGVFFRPVQEALDQMPEPEDLSHHETVRAAAEKVYDGAIAFWLGNLGSATTAAVFAHPPAGGGMPAIQGAIAGAAAGFAVVIAGAGRAAYTQAATALRADAGAHVQPTAEDAEAFTRQRAPLLEAFPEDVKAKLTTSIQRGIAAGEDTRALARRVREAIEEVQPRADVIGETEAQVAYGVAQTEALKLVGYTSKAWISVRDERVRASHVACDEQGAIPVDAPFANGLMHPGDPNGPPEEICGCRCHLEGRGDRSARVTAVDAKEASDDIKAQEAEKS